MIERGDGPRKTRRIATTVVLAIVALIAVPFVVGLVHGYAGGAASDGTALLLALLGGLLAATAIVAVAIRRGLREAAADSATGPGEAAEASRSRRFWIILGALFVTGMAVGMGAAAFEINPSGILTGTLPAWFALTAAIVTVTALTIGTALFLRRVDEVEREDNIWASAVGANALLIVYPAWFLLWKGSWVAEPGHLAMFLLTFAVMMLAYGYRKLR